MLSRNERLKAARREINLNHIFGRIVAACDYMIHRHSLTMPRDNFNTGGVVEGDVKEYIINPSRIRAESFNIPSSGIHAHGIKTSGSI